MAKADLIQNEDFRAYQKDLEVRLVEHIKRLHRIIAEPIESIEGSQGKLMRLEATTALIVELETILGLPISYMKKDDEQVAVQKQKGATKFIQMFRGIFSREGSEAED